MKQRIRKKLVKNPGRYRLHQYLKYAHQWACMFGRNGCIYQLLEDGRVIRTDYSKQIRYE